MAAFLCLRSRDRLLDLRQALTPPLAPEVFLKIRVAGLRKASMMALLLITTLPAAAAGIGSIEGRVLDHNGFGLPGVTITLKGPIDRAVLTGVDGAYRVAELPPGPYKVAATIPGYVTLEEQVEIREDTPVQLGFRLQQAFSETVVVSASRSAVSLEDSLTTISVIDQDTIETAAANQIGDLLRTVPGVNVVQSSARDINVASRQASPFLTGTQLAMVDGRPLYFDFFNVVLWDLMSASTPDVKQIEVVRGPASAMWGANAASGVVNLVTKAPRDSQGLTVTLAGGLMNRDAEAGGTGYLGNVAVSWSDAVSDKLSYRISGGYYASDAFERPTGILPVVDTPIEPAVSVGGGSFDDVNYHNEGTRQPKVDLRIDQELDGNGKIIYSAGFAGTQGIIHTPIGPFELLDNTRLAYGQASYTRGQFFAMFFTNHLTGDAPGLISVDGDGEPLLIDFANAVYNLDFGWQGLFFNNHLMTFGGNFRYNTFDISIAPGADTHQQVGIYIQDEINLGDFQLALAVRADQFSNLDKLNFSPRVAVIWTPMRGHSFKASYNRGFRAPSAIENHLDISITGGYFPVSEFDPRLEDDFPIVVNTIGNPDLKPEVIDALEVGYSTRFGGGRTRLDLNLYVSETRDSITQNPSADALIAAGVDPYYSSENPPPGWPLDPIVLDFLEQFDVRFPSTVQILNIGSVRNRGAELSLTHLFDSGLSLFGNYSYQEEPELLDPVGDPDRPRSDSVSVAPANRANLGLSYNGARYLGNVSVSYADRAFFGVGFNPAYLGYSDAYTLVGASFGKRWLEGQLTTSIKVLNALDDRARQHVFGDILRRTVMLELRWAH